MVLDFDPHSQSPIELLHTILLGPLKYCVRVTLKELSKSAKLVFTCHLESLSTDGLESGARINATYLLRHINSLVGRELKLLAQVGAIALRPLVEQGDMKELEWEAWRCLSEVAVLLYVDEIEEEDKDEYFVSSSYIQFFWIVMASCVLNFC